MEEQTLSGKCGFCKNTFSKVLMSKHLKVCEQKKGYVEDNIEKANNSGKKIFQLLVEGRGLPEYWMHLYISSDATLDDLDDFLRNIWLECCGHLSAFTIEGNGYSKSPMREYDERDMKIALGDVLNSRKKFYYTYDFGTSTELVLKVVSELEGKTKSGSIQLIARNDPPLIKCVSCGKTATNVCVECVWSDKGWLCDHCIEGHKCGEDMLLPVVNSPRVGMCGYTG